MRQFYQGLAAVVSTLFLGFFIFSVLAVISYWNPWGPEVKEPSLLTLRLQGFLPIARISYRSCGLIETIPILKAFSFKLILPAG